MGSREPEHRSRLPRLSAEFTRAAGDVGMAVLVATTAAIAVAVARATPSLEAEAARQWADEIVRDNDAFCARRGLTAGTHEHIVCVIELNEIRRKQMAHPAALLKLP
jgi:hypothetical protein